MHKHYVYVKDVSARFQTQSPNTEEKKDFIEFWGTVQPFTHT